MKRIEIATAALAALLLSGVTAAADCPPGMTPQTTGSTASDGGQQAGGISKDGTHVPLEGTTATAPAATAPAAGGASDTNTADAAAGNGVAKDGATMPLATEQGGGDNQIAMSGQDAVAQQQGGQTAAAAAGQGECK